MQCCTVTQLRDKEVISTKNGCRVGYVTDVEINRKEGKLCALLIYQSRPKGALFAKPEPLRIPWEDIEIIGDDTILVRFAPPAPPPAPPKPGLFSF